VRRQEAVSHSSRTRCLCVSHQSQHPSRLAIHHHTTRQMSHVSPRREQTYPAALAIRGHSRAVSTEWHPRFLVFGGLLKDAKRASVDPRPHQNHHTTTFDQLTTARQDGPHDTKRGVLGFATCLAEQTEQPGTGVACLVDQRREFAPKKGCSFCACGWLAGSPDKQASMAARCSAVQSVSCCPVRWYRYSTMMMRRPDSLTESVGVHDNNNNSVRMWKETPCRSYLVVY
jgi:hypothetical protein